MIGLDTDFTQIKDLRKYLQGQWVYVSDGTKWRPSDLERPVIYERVKLMDQGLEIYRPGSEPMDGILRPRTEIVPVHARLPKLKPLVIRYRFKGTQIQDMRGMVFQIMDHENDKKGTLPVFQFEVRYGYLHTRWSVIENGKNVGGNIHRIATFDQEKWYDLKVECLLTHQKTGYTKVFLDDEFVWQRINVVTASEFGHNPQIQYGVYCVPGMDLRTVVSHLSWETEGPDHIFKMPAVKTKTILAMGQSNCVAAGNRIGGTDPHVRADYYDRVQWVDWKTDPNQLSRDSQMRFASTSSNSSLPKYVANELLKRGVDNIIIIPTAAGGTPIWHWRKGSDLFENTVRACGQRAIDYVVWHQGESDRKGPQKYDKKLGQFFKDLQHAIPGITQNTRFCLGHIAKAVENADAINKKINYFVSQDDRFSVVHCSTFPTRSDNMHFDGFAIREMGKLYAKSLFVPFADDEKDHQSSDPIDTDEEPDRSIPPPPVKLEMEMDFEDQGIEGRYLITIKKL
jgi:hypothetical protein